MKIGSFDIRELVPPSIHAKYGDKSIWFLDTDAIKFLHFSRKRYGKPHFVNTWHTGGQFENRGFRLPGSTTGALLSQHKFGRAFDWNVAGMTPDEIRADILANQEEWMANGLTTIEDGKYAPTWVHGDSRWTGLDAILIVKP